MSSLTGTLELFWSNPHILQIFVKDQERAFMEDMGPGKGLKIEQEHIKL